MLEYQPAVIRRLREEQGRRIDELAVAAQLSEQHLRNLERGALPRADTLGRLASALDVPVTAFYVEGPDRPRRRVQTSAQAAGA